MRFTDLNFELKLYIANTEWIFLWVFIDELQTDIPFRWMLLDDNLKGFLLLGEFLYTLLSINTVFYFELLSLREVLICAFLNLLDAVINVLFILICDVRHEDEIRETLHLYETKNLNTRHHSSPMNFNSVCLRFSKRSLSSIFFISRTSIRRMTFLHSLYTPSIGSSIEPYGIR